MGACVKTPESIALDQEIIRLRIEEKCSYATIGRLLGIGKNAAIGRARRAGVPTDDRFKPTPHAKREEIKAQLAAGRGVREVAQMTGADPKRVFEYRARMRAAGHWPQPISPALIPREIVAATLGPPPAISSSVTCQYVIGEKPGAGRSAPMCGDPVKLGKSYCPTHYDLCCRPVQRPVFASV